jgi:hypothetical protein
MFLDDVDYLVEDVVCNPSYQFNVLSAYHVIIAFHRIYCTVYVVAYAIASYRIAGGVAGSSAGRADLDRSARALGTGGA